MSIVLGSFYAGNIDYYCALSTGQDIIIDTYQHFQKQSYRNRCVIAGANGRLNLIVPVQRKRGKSPLKEVKIENHQNWKKIHWKSLESAYRTSPFFEYYEHEFHSIFILKKHNYLLDLNNDILNATLKCLQIEANINFSTSYMDSEESLTDLRESIHPKKEPSKFYNQPVYDQVFEDRMDHLENLSILDLLFNEGPMASDMLKK